MLVDHNIKNLNGGVSQQPEELRYDVQVEEMNNMMPTLRGELKTVSRPTGVDILDSSSFEAKYDNIATHYYDRGDGLEKYFMILNQEGLKIFDIDGVQKDINENPNATDPIYGYNPDVYDYFSGISNYRRDIKFLTVGDTTWILNKNKTTALRDKLVEKLSNRTRAFYWLKRSFDDGQGNGYDYTVIINGVEFTTNDNSSEDGASSLSTSINQRYSNPANDPLTFPDWIRAVSIGSILSVYVAKVYSPNFRLGTGYTAVDLLTPTSTTNKFVRVKNGGGQIYGVSIDDYETSFKIISGEYELYSTMEGGQNPTYWDLSLRTSNFKFAPRYYSNANQAVSDTSGVDIWMQGYTTTGSEDFEISFSDSWGNQASIGWKGSITKLSDLPSSMSGFTKKTVGTIEVTGTDDDEFNSYYLTWNNDRWKEVSKEEIKYIIDYRTMPIKIVRTPDGSFDFGYNTDGSETGDYSWSEYFDDKWEERLIGDDDLNPIPSFIDSSITNMFFFKNRLCFTSNENVIMSEVGKYYNFWATTAMEIIDSDMIDVSIDSNNVADIKNISLVGNGVTLWSSGGQYFLSGGDVLTPESVRISQASSYEALERLEPISLDNEVYFFNEINGYINTNIYSPATVNQDSTSAQSVSAHCPEYVPNDCDIVVSSSKHNILFFVNADDSNNVYLYCYKYHNIGQDRVLSAWFRLEIRYDIKRLHGMFIDGDYLNVIGTWEANNSRLVLWKLNISDIENDSVECLPNAYVIMSKFNIFENDNIRDFRDKFYFQNIKVKRIGDVNGTIDIINSQRNDTRSQSLHIIGDSEDRPIHIGSNSENIKIKIRASGDEVFGTQSTKIGSLSISGRVNNKSKNF